MPGISTRFPQPQPRIAIAIVFLVAGLVAGTWFGRIPAVTSNLDLETGQIGSLLLFLSLGSLVAFQFIGRLVLRHGSARMTLVFATLAALALPLLALAPVPALLGAAMFGFGFAVGSTGVSMNAQGVVVERRIGARIMGALHGYFTLGTLIGSALGGLLAEAGIGPVPHFLASALISLLALAMAGPSLVPDGPAPEGDRPGGLSLPPPALVPLGILAFCAGVGEGSMYDWSALYVHDGLGGSEGLGAMAFATFSLAMLAGRFSGDRIVEAIGTVNVVRYGGILGGAGLATGLAIGTIPAAFAGFAVLGLGLSILMPLYYRAAGTFPGIPSVRGVAAIATMGFLGLLAGPPTLGTIADATSLRVSLGIVVLLCGAMALLAPAVRDIATPSTIPAPATLPEEAVP